MSSSSSPSPLEYLVPVRDGVLSCREVGAGPTVVVIHGGPDFDHTYLLPDLDRLATRYRLVYYDQRWRGGSRAPLRMDEVRIETYVEDLEALRRHLGLDALILLGHSWGGTVAMHHACAHPARVSHLILMNTAPASHEDALVTRAERLRRWAADGQALDALAATPAYEDGDPAIVSAFYARLYAAGARHPERLQGLRLQWSREDILSGRAIEDALIPQLFGNPAWSLLPALRRLPMPTLVLHGDDDLVPVACAARIADAIPGARLVVLPECGHFSYLEAPEAVAAALADFLDEVPR